MTRKQLRRLEQITRARCHNEGTIRLLIGEARRRNPDANPDELERRLRLSLQPTGQNARTN
jgi:hypothetical protein